MKTIQIRDVPEDVHRALRSRAGIAGLSLSEYLLREVTRVADRPPVAEVLKQASARTGGAASEAILEAVREARQHS